MIIQKISSSTILLLLFLLTVFLTPIASAQSLPSWSTPVQLSNGSTMYYYALATNGDSVHVVRGDGTVLYRRSTNQGQTWSTDVTIGSGTPFLEKPIITEGNTLYVIYVRNIRDVTDSCCPRKIGDIFFRVSPDNGTTWRPEIQLTTARSAMRVSLAASGSTVHLTWMDYRTNAWDIYYLRSLDGGATWQSEVNHGPGGRPQIESNGQTVHLTYGDTRNGETHIYYKRSLNNGATWGPEVKLSSNTPYAGRPDVETTGNTVIVAWEQDTEEDPTADNDVYIRRSTDNGTTWLPSQRMSNALGDSSHEDMTINSSAVHIAWHDSRNPQNKEIYYRLSNDLGVIWGPEQIISNAPGESAVPMLGATSNYIHAIWGDNRTGSSQVWYSRKNLAGTSCPADINGDRAIDISDYAILAANFLKTSLTNSRADINTDGVVDISDYAILAARFLTPCG